MATSKTMKAWCVEASGRVRAICLTKRDAESALADWHWRHLDNVALRAGKIVRVEITPIPAAGRRKK